MQTNWMSRVQRGMDVYDTNANKMGSIDQVAEGAGSYFDMKTGLFGMGNHYYIPFDAIQDVNDQGVFLSVDKGNLDQMGWEQPPAATDTYAAGAYTGATEAGAYPDTYAGEGVGERRYAPATGQGETTGRTVELREERLQPRKETVQTGEVGLHKEVVTERRQVEVPVQREEVYIDRHPVEPHPSDQPIGEGDYTDETIRVPVREERVSVEKQPVVTGEVTVGKRQVQETRQFSGDVRREEAHVERSGDPNVEEDYPEELNQP